MITVLLKKVENGVPPPTYNGFPIVAHDVFYAVPVGLFIVDTGLEIQLCPNQTIEIRSEPDLIVVSWTMSGFQLPNAPQIDRWPEGRIVVVVFSEMLQQGQKIGEVSIVEQKGVNVRFMQHSPEGGRIVRGDAQIANCTENREPES